MDGTSPGNDSDRFQWVDATAASEMLGRTTRTLREWANKGRIERQYGEDNKVYYRIETPRNEDGNGGSKEEVNGEVSAEIHPELYRQVAGERDFLREQHAELILQLSRKEEEVRECRQRLDFLTLFSVGMLRQLPTGEERVSEPFPSQEASARNGRTTFWQRLLRRAGRSRLIKVIKRSD